MCITLFRTWSKLIFISVTNSYFYYHISHFRCFSLKQCHNMLPITNYFTYNGIKREQISKTRPHLVIDHLIGWLIRSALEQWNWADHDYIKHLWHYVQFVVQSIFTYLKCVTFTRILGRYLDPRILWDTVIIVVKATTLKSQ